jgi:hypothetical protein
MSESQSTDNAAKLEDGSLNINLLDEEKKKGWFANLSNQQVLAITCAMFAMFVVAEIIGALVSTL